MIATVRGAVHSAAPGTVAGVGGAGLAVWATPAAPRTGERARLPAAPALREDWLTLSGSADAWTRGRFALRRAVSGIAPREALAAQAVLDPDAPCDALAESGATPLARAPGVGCEGAGRLGLELRGKADPAPRTAQPPGGGGFRDEVVGAPTSLGLATQRAERAVAGASGDGATGGDWAAPRGALPALGPRR